MQSATMTKINEVINNEVYSVFVRRTETSLWFTPSIMRQDGRKSWLWKVVTLVRLFVVGIVDTVLPLYWWSDLPLLPLSFHLLLKVRRPDIVSLTTHHKWVRFFWVSVKLRTNPSHTHTQPLHQSIKYAAYRLTHSCVAQLIIHYSNHLYSTRL